MNYTSKGTKVLDETVLSQFLGADGVLELRSKIIDMIVDEVREQLRDSSNYIISPDNIASDLYDSVIKEICDEIKDDYKNQITKAIQKKLSVLNL